MKIAASNTQRGGTRTAQEVIRFDGPESVAVNTCWTVVGCCFSVVLMRGLSIYAVAQLHSKKVNRGSTAADIKLLDSTIKPR